MKKQTFLVVVTIIFFLLLSSDCTEKTNSATAKFLGTWKTIGSSSENETWTFYQNGTVKNIQNQTLDEESIPFTSTTWFRYEVNDTDLCLSSIETSPESPSNYSECFTYQFSATMDQVTLSFQGVQFLIFTKVS
jgi:hypothetical protein